MGAKRGPEHRVRLVAGGVGLLLSGLAMAIWTTSSQLGFEQPGPGVYQWAGLAISAWWPAASCVLGYLLLAGALARRASPRTWAAVAVLFVAFAAAFTYWGSFSLSGPGPIGPGPDSSLLQH